MTYSQNIGYSSIHGKLSATSIYSYSVYSLTTCVSVPLPYLSPLPYSVDIFVLKLSIPPNHLRSKVGQCIHSVTQLQF